MANSAISGLTAMSAPSAADLLVAVDVNDTTMSSNGTDKKMTLSQLLASLTGAVTYSGFAGSLAPIANNDILANISGTSAAPVATSLTALIDAAIDNTQGDLLFRGASTWGKLSPGTANTPLQSGGASANPSYNSNILLPAAGPTRWTTGPFLNITGSGTAVANTTTQTSLFTGATFRSGQSLTIPANALSAGQAIRLSLFGTFGCTASSPTLTLYLMLGGIVIAQSITQAINSAVAVTNGEWYSGSVPIQIFIPSIGSSGSTFAVGQPTFLNTPSVQASTAFLLEQGAAVGTGTAITINTTNSLALDIQAKWGTASSTNTIQLLGGYAELIGG